YRQGSKQIQPVVDNANGILLGFKVLDADGKTYEFLRPVMNYFQYNYTRNYPDRNTTKSEVENETHSPYATTWYLTGIKGADYFDRGENGFSAEDWGFWVKFNYKRLAHPVGFRTPFSGDAKVPNKDGVAASIIRSYGAKEKVYLESIETASHIAFFDKSDRTDNLSPYVEYLAFEAFDVDGTDSSLEIKFPFDKADIASLLNSSAELVLEYMIKYEPYDHYPPPADGGWVTQTSTAANNTETYTYSVDFSDSDPVTGDQEWTITSIDAVNGVTSIPKSHGYPDPSPTTVYEGGYISAATLKLYPTSGNKLANFAKKLDQIRLVRKTLNSSDDKTDYTASNSNETIEGVKFTYDYSLQNGAENATTGKLTLKSIQKTGIDDQIALPASNLAYNNDLDGGSVTWSREKYDYWNGYSSYASDTDPERLHFNSFQKSIADRDAALWNLSEIESPLGAKTKIFYESDVISYVKDKQEKDVLLALGGPSEPTSITSSKIRVSWADSCRYDVFDGTSSGETRNFDIYTSGSSPTFIATIEVNKVYVNIIVQSPYVDFYTVEDPTSLGLLTDGTAYSFYEGDSRTAIYAGGHRINKVEVTDGLNSLTTFYTYSDGTTPVLPSAYRDLVTLSTDDHANDAYIIDKKYNNLGPSPSLGYSQVTVKEVKRESDGSYTPTKGRTIHKFYTAKDSIAQFAVLDTITDKLIITDKTGIIGKPKSVETYAMKDNTDGSSESDYYLIKKDDFYYDFSSDLISSNRKVYDGSFSTSLSSDKALGISHQNYQGTKDTDSTTVVNHIRENVFMTGTSSEFYFYDGSWNQTKYLTTGSNLAYDALTGKTLVTQTYRSEGKKTVNEIIPAYWNYDYYTQVGTSNYHVDNMLEKNMLMQESENRVYTLSSSDDWFSLTSTEKNNRITSASVTTWKPWIESHNYTGFVDSVYWEAFWRKNDTYEWISTGAFDDFSSSDWENYDLGDFHNSRKWKRTSNITKYDRYSHPVEEKGMDGTYTASIYGQGDALPIAIAKNAKRSQIIYIDFEEGQSTRNSSIYSGDQINYTAYFNNAKTGQYSQVTSSYPVTIPSESGTYTITYWRKEGSDPWELIRATGQTAGSTYTITGSSVRIDDIRVYPDQATMSTFTYDPLTWKLTSITDANNITTYYEYDTMGRLIKVLDHEQYLKQFHAYAYGRNH
ncbi:MAG: hypothetical protein KDD94_00850, partial [Calditrichaeota bacterium]|nr:hypothetical protein [Calditrichota bacterium]